MSNSNTSFNKPSNGRNEDIEREVANIFKKNKSKSTYQLMEELRAKYRDEEIVDSIMKKFQEKMKRVRKIAEKIRERLLNKYPNLSQREYIDKIQEYKKKYNFDESELQAIINLVLLRKDGLISSEHFEPGVTEMGKALGFVPISYQTTGRLRVPKDEQEQLEAIKNNYHITRELHNQVTIQSLIYGDCDIASWQESFDKLKINIFNFVHPVVAALFFPKIDLLDQHMLLASIAGIITKKMEGLELNTLPEYELYWDIATDPAEMACVTKVKPFTDLLNRCNVQTKLWESVLHLRQGKYYMNDIASFLMAVDACRASVFDAADLAYVKDEGTILRKLFASFSLRPTIVVTVPSLSINTNPAISNLASTHITTLSMVTLRIPLGYNTNVLQEIDLQEALTQDQIYIHHRQLTLKKQTILYSREILVFYIHRRYQQLNIARIATPYALASLPITMSQFEKLQTAGVNYLPTITLSTGHNQEFNIKSVVAVETREMAGSKDEIIISCSTLVHCPVGTSGGKSKYGFKYNPLNIGSGGLVSDPTGKAQVKPISLLDEEDSTDVDGNVVLGFESIARTKGTLFIYTSPKIDASKSMGFDI